MKQAITRVESNQTSYLLEDLKRRSEALRGYL